MTSDTWDDWNSAEWSGGPADGPVNGQADAALEQPSFAVFAQPQAGEPAPDPRGSFDPGGVPFDEEPPFDPDYDLPVSPARRAAQPPQSSAAGFPPPAAPAFAAEPPAPAGPATYTATVGFVPPTPHQLPRVTVMEPGMLVSHAPSPLLQAAELYLSLLAITRSDAETLSAEDPFAGASTRPPVVERGTTPEAFVGADGIRLIEAYFDYLWPLRSQATNRSIAHCEGCGEHWYIPAGATKPPSKCSMTAGCPGVVHKAYVRLSPQAEKAKREQKLKSGNLGAAHEGE